MRGISPVLATVILIAITLIAAIAIAFFIFGLFTAPQTVSCTLNGQPIHGNLTFTGSTKIWVCRP